MIAMPSIVLISMMAMLSFFSTTILSRPWQQHVAFACGVIEVAAVIILIVEARL